MRLFDASGVPESTEVAARILTAYSRTGDQVSLPRELTVPTNARVSGDLSAISPIALSGQMLSLIQIELNTS